MELTGKTPLRSRLSSRSGSTWLAIIAAGVAAILVFAAINSARKDNAAGTASSTVLVANQLIPKGSSGQALAQQHLFRVAKVNQQALVAGAVTDISQLHDRIASQDIYPGQQISAESFGAANGALAAKLAATDRAVSIPLDAAHGLIGAINAGDHVDVLAGFNIQSTNGTRPVMRVLATNVSVLKVDKSSGAGTGANADVTLRVNADMATKVAFAADNGKLWVVLRPAAGAKDPSASVVSVNSLLFGVKPLQVNGK
ncbi:MAG TPA: Flp pilus assembly protein CpaB [Solirubrobacteraceae bacterium]|nr:Flp pilus assembly protein CpaB [Solirubrobacteraceae bacterium]